jgi:YNFM family putative membrane transporter
LLYDVQPLLPLFAHRFGTGAANASLSVSLATGTMALAFIPAGILSDRVGRLPVMVFSLFASATLTILSAVLSGWNMLLVMRALTGIAIAGVPSVAMAYVAEEVAPLSSGSAMGLYIGGSAIGGMAGRLGMTLAAELFGWRGAMAAMGTIGLVVATAFRLLAPAPRVFVAKRHDLRSVTAATKRLMCDKALPLLFAEGFLLMGAFVSVYNYVGFRLQEPPYPLSQPVVGLIFLFYIIGSFSSAWFGGLASRVGHAKVFWMPIVGLAAGIALTAVRPLALIILGIAVITGCFFAAHSTASGWVGRRATRDRAQASSLYLLFYYLGSSILGTIGGVAWTHFAWEGVAAYGVSLVLVALAIATGLARVRALGAAPARPSFPPSGAGCGSRCSGLAILSHEKGQ